jgi:hypothetical protein
VELGGSQHHGWDRAGLSRLLVDQLGRVVARAHAVDTHDREQDDAVSACSVRRGLDVLGGRREERRGLCFVLRRRVAHVDDPIHPCKRLVEPGTGAQVGAALARHDDDVGIRGRERVHDEAPDESCPSDHRDPHGASLPRPAARPRPAGQRSTACRNPAVNAASAAGNACSAGVPKPTTIPGRRGCGRCQ